MKSQSFAMTMNAGPNHARCPPEAIGRRLAAYYVQMVESEPVATGGRIDGA
jgi:hypothetical protein